MKFLQLSIVFFIVQLIGTLTCLSQKYVSDSLTIGFGTSSNTIKSYKVDSVFDKRSNLIGTQIRISERKKYVYIPVDFYYVTAFPLATEMKSLFADSIKNDTIVTLVIDRFEISYRIGFKPLPVLYAQIKVYSSVHGNTKKFLGTLVYETVGEKPKKKKEKECFENLIEKWKGEFSNDLVKLKPITSTKRDIKFYNLFSPNEKASQTIYSEAAFITGSTWWMLDADIGFFDPEATRKFFRNTSFVRYRNEKRFESIAFGARSYYYYYRINEKFVANIEQKFCIGVNRWKDMNTFNHKLYDIVNVDVGLRAGAYYFPFGKRSIMAGLVTTHDLIYIYSMHDFYRPGLGLVFGINF